MDEILLDAEAFTQLNIISIDKASSPLLGVGANKTSMNKGCPSSRGRGRGGRESGEGPCCGGGNH